MNRKTPLLIAVLAGAALSAHAQNLVVNPGFETGAFTFWTLGGATRLCFVTHHPHSGMFAAALGTTCDFPDCSATLDQTITTVVGQLYHVDFWLANDLNFNPPLNVFSATFSGHIFYSVVNAPNFPYTDFSANITATSTSSLLHFAFFNNRHNFTPAYWHLDDVSVTACPSAGSWTE